MSLPSGWANASLDTVLDYEQPTKYIVDSTEYSDKYPTPVLTAGKSFIIGYTNETNGIYRVSLPVIIFDDFTTATQFVTFPFKVKSSAMKILQPASSELSKKYIYYYMETIKHNVTTHKRYWISDYSKNNIFLAPSPEQRRIVEKIDALFSKLDKGVEMLQTIKQQLKVYKQAVLHAAFTPSKDWRTAKTYEVGEVQLGRQRSPENISKLYPTKYLRAANITENGLDISDVYDMEFTPDERERYTLKENDIVLSEASGSANQVGKPAIWKNEIPQCCFQNTIIRHRITLANPRYVYWHYKYYYQTGYFSKIVGGVGINHLGAKNFSSVVLWLAPEKQQQAIVSTIESRLSVCDKLEQLVDETLSEAEALRQSILKKAFSGQLVPQDPNDEPAEKLIERIIAEHGKFERKALKRSR